ncbi:uncharacterized protein LOC142629059 [Castanea sativa]|uniref:uncharacterized protein LOC142629059 n=1 Tax=Castanea sativa TaxID=21020 RepID=UPI003F64F970
MNILLWNCRGALNPLFHVTLKNLIVTHSPSIVIITETRVGGERAKDITDRLPFDGALHADTIGYSGGIWVLWKLEERKLLWKNLASIAPMHDLPWLMLGDFNEMLSSSDKLGGNPLIPRRVQMFKDCLDSCGMVDLGFHGPRFTWVNKREVGHFIQERLDRGFANSEWRRMYLEAAIHHLVRTHSDHCPVLLKMDNNGLSNLSRSFRFQPMWMSHPLFSDFVADSCMDDGPLNLNVEKFTADVKIWNKEVFGDIFQRKKRLEARLRGIQSRIADGLNLYLLNLECQLRKEYSEVLQSEEEFWLEVKEGLWSLKPLKAPGPDGIHAGFFQAYWQLVGTSVVNEVCKVFQDSTMPPHLNETLITLIPKYPGADCLASFRPISLCNIVYKVVTKIIVKRLRPFLPNLISPLQTAFVLGRMGLDNMIIA